MTLTTALLVAVIQQARLERQSLEVAIIDSLNGVEYISCRALHKVDSVQKRSESSTWFVLSPLPDGRPNLLATSEVLVVP